MITVEQVVDAIRATRTEFSVAFLQAQTNSVAEERIAFEVVSQLVNEREAYREALLFAQGKGFFEILIDTLINISLEDGALKRLRSGGNGAAGAQPSTLQAMIDENLGFAQPDVMAKGYDNAIRWTGKVFIDSAFQGTGVLIGPHLLLTAWHVVRKAFVLNGGKWEPDQQAGNRIMVDFDDYYIAGTNNRVTQTPERVPARKDNWCVLFSNCTDEELNDQLPNPPSLLDGFWDYAVIQLSRTVGLERTWAILDTHSIVPQPNEEIIVFQYPGGQPMKTARHTIYLTEPPPDQQVIPRLRFLHGANALNGSSGGPCFDKSFALFGLHQGEWIWQPAGGKRTNRGIPITRILEDIKTRKNNLPPPDPSDVRIWSLGKTEAYHPVLGTDRFQGIVWDSVLNGRNKIVDIKGAPGTGKTLLISLLGVMLPEAGYLQIKLNAETISKQAALQIAREICKEARIEPPNFITQTDMNATSVTWVKDELATKVINALDTARNGRQVWLCIAELNKFDIVGELASEFLYALYEKALQTDWFRILLDGLKGSLPEPMLRSSVTYRIGTLVNEDIERFFQRFFASLRLPVIEATLTAVVRECMKKYNKWLNENEETAMRLLAEDVSDKLDSYTP